MKHETLTEQETKQVLGYFKNTDSGKYGKAFEIAVKIYFNGNKGNSHKVALKGHTDMQYHGATYEIKSNCGELGSDLMNKDYIIYSMDNIVDCFYPLTAVVMTPAEFWNMLDTLGLIRTKTTTAGTVKTTIQSYKNSKRKTALLLGALAQYPTIDEWVLTH